MRDLLTWSLPCGTLFGITIRVHVLFPVVAIGLIIRAVVPSYAAELWIIASGLMAILFFSVLLHELGHCFAARYMEGDATEVLIWPLGGLASIDIPPTARANLVTALCGPLVNLLICVLAGGLLTYERIKPPFFPWSYDPYQSSLLGWNPALELTIPWLSWVARGFYINWLLFLINMLPGMPLDGGKVFQCLLWPRHGFRQATLYAVYAGYCVTIAIGIYSIAAESVLALFLACFVYVTCTKQMIILEHGGEESIFGYDFSQGYTSLEREAPPKRKRKPNFIQRWLQQRALKKLQLETERREAEDNRMDQLLEKVQREGLHALTDEERRFLTRVSARYKDKS